MSFSLCERCLSFHIQHVCIGAFEVGIKFLKATADLYHAVCPHQASELCSLFFFNQIIQGRQNLSILIFIFVTEGLKKTKKKWQENELGLLQFQCSPCLSYSRATTLKIGVVIVYVCARLQCVCVFAQVPKTFGSVYNMCLCWEWMQVALENRAAPQLALLFI